MDTKHSNCHSNKKKFDYLLWGSILISSILYIGFWKYSDNLSNIKWLSILSGSVFELINTIWWGVLIGIVFVAILSKVPKEFVISILGNSKGISGKIRATIGGVLLDLCSHGILMVGSQLYKRGASSGQVMAFLIASPWNSLSLTIILISLIGIFWTLSFIFLSLVIAIITGVIFDKFVDKGILPDNPNKIDLPQNFKFFEEARKGLMNANYNLSSLLDMLINGIKESRMVIKWILFGTILAGLVRAFVDADSFQTFFGPTLAGLGLTIIVATILEVCSEGSTPIAADILTRAKAPGNSFAFLMTGVSTDYTEIMILKDTTKSWKIALFLPLLTVPQVIFISWLINHFSIL
ncbi:permease [Rickettsiales bacterium]|nr:permease [Rickettsiales bacterium]